MHKNLIQFAVYITLLLLLQTSCKKDSTEPAAIGSKIQFDQLTVGQESKYIGLLGENYFDNSTDDFVYTDDTLILRVVGQDSNGFKLTETLKYVGDVDSWMAGDKDEVYSYYLNVRNDSLIVTPEDSDYLESRIFTYPISAKGLSLVPIISPEVQVIGWKTSLGYCECYREGYSENYTLFGQLYDQLNVLIDNSPMALDGAGSTYVYAGKYGIVRFSTYGWWTQSGYGWDLLP